MEIKAGTTHLFGRHCDGPCGSWCTNDANKR